MGNGDEIIVSPCYNGLFWCFKVRHEGKLYNFVGMPNVCWDKRCAYMRGLWRLRWLRDGSYHTRYQFHEEDHG